MTAIDHLDQFIIRGRCGGDQITAFIFLIRVTLENNHEDAITDGFSLSSRYLCRARPGALLWGENHSERGRLPRRRRQRSLAAAHRAAHDEVYPRKPQLR